MEHIDKTIEELRTTISEKENELAEMRKTVNQLCKLTNRSPIYITEAEPSAIATGVLRGDEYYMQPIASVIGWILEGRKLSGAGPATIKEIYDAMKAGGYKFDAKDDTDAMRGISISVSKNVAKFHKLPSGKFGLTEWYPELKEKKQPPGKVPMSETLKIVKEQSTTQSEIESETPATIKTEGQTEQPKRRGRPKKVVQQETISEEPKE